MEDLAVKPSFGNVFFGNTVFVTGHTGFKGAWLSLWLHSLGAKVVGFARVPDTQPSLFEQLGLARLIDSRIGDVRDAALVAKIVRETRPQIIFHLAAQPLVRLSYEQPLETFQTNVLGTANVLDAARKTDSVRVCQVITTDKCYENLERDYAYREDDRLGGRDPYSASKACAELAVSSYRDSFLKASGISVSSVRAGNVIGGGDWARDRLVPDCVRALAGGRSPKVRNPRSVRPWQHVLEPLSGYLSLASRQLVEPHRFSGAWNFGPAAKDALPALKIAELIVRYWGSSRKVGIKSDPAAPHEAGLLKLDSSKARKELAWRPVYRVEEALERTVVWYKAAGERRFDALDFTRRQIEEYSAHDRESLAR